MNFLLAVLAMGCLTGWCVARSAPEGVSAALSVLVLASVLGLVPLGRLEQRVLFRSD